MDMRTASGDGAQRLFSPANVVFMVFVYGYRPLHHILPQFVSPPFPFLIWKARESGKEGKGDYFLLSLLSLAFFLSVFSLYLSSSLSIIASLPFSDSDSREVVHQSAASYSVTIE